MAHLCTLLHTHMYKADKQTNKQNPQSLLGLWDGSLVPSPLGAYLVVPQHSCLWGEPGVSLVTGEPWFFMLHLAKPSSDLPASSSFDSLDTHLYKTHPAIFENPPGDNSHGATTSSCLAMAQCEAAHGQGPCCSMYLQKLQTLLLPVVRMT